MEANDVAVRPAKREVLLGNGSTYTYGSKAPPSIPTTVRRAFFLRAPTPSKTVWPGEFLEVQLPDDALPDSEYVLTHLVYVISSLLGSGRNPVSFPVLCRQYAYQTCKPSLESLSVTKTSARSPLSQNQNNSQRQVRLLLSVRYHPLILVTPHSSRQSHTAFSPRLSEPISNFCSVSTTPYLTLSSQVSMDPQALTKQRSTWAPSSPHSGKAASPNMLAISS